MQPHPQPQQQQQQQTTQPRASTCETQVTHMNVADAAHTKVRPDDGRLSYPAFPIHERSAAKP